jgi:predicted RNA-binding protein associated with RNAse of E/G family
MEFIDEIKIHKNKETQIFRCQVIHRQKNHIVLFYKSQEDRKIKNITIKKGSFTIAYYWTARGYVLWKLFDEKKQPIGALFHVCKNVSISDSAVTYLDLIVDIWISPDGLIKVLDEDELEECKNSGLITQDEMDWIENQKKFILKNHSKIIRSARIRLDFQGHVRSD